MSYYEGRPVCYVGCDEQSECPGGYQCSIVIRPLPSGCANDYIILGSACIAPLSMVIRSSAMSSCT